MVVPGVRGPARRARKGGGRDESRTYDRQERSLHTGDGSGGLLVVFLRPVRHAAVLRRLPPGHRIYAGQGGADSRRAGVLVWVQALREWVPL